MSEEKTESASVGVKALHKSRHHREKTPQEFPAHRHEGDDTDQDVEPEAVATIGHPLERNRRRLEIQDTPIQGGEEGKGLTDQGGESQT